jgi:hypothetical protein
MPTIAADNSVVAALGGERFEAVEGFWIPRPWLLEPVCPAAAPPAAARQPTGSDSSPQPEPDSAPEPVPSLVRPRVGIAQFFTSTDARTKRRSARPYSAVKTLEAGERAGQQGFNLVLSGRLQAPAGARVIQCTAPGPDLPPDCIVSADFDRVWIEEPATKAIVAEWSSG